MTKLRNIIHNLACFWN